MKGRRITLRNSPTPQELKLWYFLKNKNLSVKFRRQHGIGSYITDFYCKEKNLIIELDGFQHVDNKEYDKERSEYFNVIGIKVLRFWNSEIDNNIEEVLNKIKKEFEFCSPAKGSCPKN